MQHVEFGNIVSHIHWKSTVIDELFKGGDGLIHLEEVRTSGQNRVTEVQDDTCSHDDGNRPPKTCNCREGN